MELVIKITKKLYDRYKKTDHIKICELDEFEKALDKCIILPKGHGRLIDADELYDGFIDGTEGYDCQTWNRIEIGDIIEDAPTIIEADKESEEWFILLKILFLYC